MKQIKVLILKSDDKNAKDTAQELVGLLQDNWIIVNQDRTHNAVIYILAKVPEELLRQMQNKQTLANILK